ncbi:MAG: hypothetical protein ACI3WU_05740 [Phascolarctobacterium sp.]
MDTKVLELTDDELNIIRDLVGTEVYRLKKAIRTENILNELSPESADEISNKLLIDMQKEYEAYKKLSKKLFFAKYGREE